MGINDTTTLSHHPYILCHFATTYTNMVCVCCVWLWKAVGSVVVGVYCIFMCMESELCCGLLQCSCCTEHGRYGLSWLYAKTAVHEQWRVCVLCWSVWNFIAAEHMGRLLCVRLWSEQSWVPCSFNAYMGRLSACTEFCGVHSWQNGTRCRDGVKVLWCHWFPSSLRLPSIHVLVFIQKIFCDLFLLFF